MNAHWPFGDPEQTEVITLERILQGRSSVLLVTHDEDDGAWQFLDGEHVFEDDGAVVCLGEMVQLDPSLGQLGDLPVGWYGWRPEPGQPWRRAAGEPPVTPDRREDNADAGHPGAKNVEIKARVLDLDGLRQAAESISDTAVEVLDQEDIFFSAPEGRLKLRILGEDAAELIHYHRPDTAEPKASRLPHRADELAGCAQGDPDAGLADHGGCPQMPPALPRGPDPHPSRPGRGTGRLRRARGRAPSGAG